VVAPIGPIALGVLTELADLVKGPVHRVRDIRNLDARHDRPQVRPAGPERVPPARVDPVHGVSRDVAVEVGVPASEADQIFLRKAPGLWVVLGCSSGDLRIATKTVDQAVGTALPSAGGNDNRVGDSVVPGLASLVEKQPQPSHVQSKATDHESDSSHRRAAKSD